ncbi:MAG TPA: helix-turn-helix transcriptional regulator [Bacillales bacterium]|nr:helix-turn-helix transcriptional regulator [Bacillales bacterium]
MENKILEFLDGRPITQLEERSGVHRNTIASYIKGADPKLSKADRIAAALGKTIYEVWPGLNSFCADLHKNRT